MNDEENKDLDIKDRIKRIESGLDFSIFPNKKVPEEKNDSEEEKEAEAMKEENEIIEEDDNKLEEEIMESLEEKPIENELVDEQEEKIEEIIPENNEIEEEQPQKRIVIEGKPEIKDRSKNKKEDSDSKKKKKLILNCIISILFLIISIIGYKNVKKDNYIITENSNVNYQVCLKDNNYYTEKCINEDGEYISSVTDTIQIDFSYNAEFQKVDKKDYQYYIKSLLFIKTADQNEKELYHKETRLTDIQDIKLNGRLLNIAKTVEIPYIEYDQYAQKYKNDFALASKSYVEVSLVLIEENYEKEAATLIIPLNQKTYHINKRIMKDQKTLYRVKTNPLFIMIFVILIIIAYIMIWKSFERLCKSMWDNIIKKSKYQRELDRILRRNDRDIVTLKDNIIIKNTEVEYEVQSFKELLDAKEAVGEPILYRKISNKESVFIIQDDNKTYKYTIKESDFYKNK